MTAPLRLLFVCVENSCRSQMAEAFARHLGGARVEARSAGSRPSGVVSPKAVASMREIGLDLSAQASKGLREVAPAGAPPFDAVVSMGCGDACPWVPARRRVDWQVPDPRDLPPEDFARVRDLIGREVQALSDLDDEEIDRILAVERHPLGEGGGRNEAAHRRALGDELRQAARDDVWGRRSDSKSMPRFADIR